jgi:hypothetical protein
MEGGGRPSRGTEGRAEGGFVGVSRISESFGVPIGLSACLESGPMGGKLILLKGDGEVVRRLEVEAAVGRSSTSDSR